MNIMIKSNDLINIKVLVEPELSETNTVEMHAEAGWWERQDDQMVILTVESEYGLPGYGPIMGSPLHAIKIKFIW